MANIKKFTLHKYTPTSTSNKWIKELCPPTPHRGKKVNGVLTHDDDWSNKLSASL